MNSKLFAKGGCQCGSVTLEISEKPEMMVQCHCLDCQKSTGTGHTSNAYFDKMAVTIDGETIGHTVTADSGNKMTRYFCPQCGSRLFGHNSGRPGLVSVQIGCLEDNSWFSPQAVLYSSRSHDWDITSDEIVNYKQMAPD